MTDPHPSRTRQFASINSLTKHTLRTYLNARHEDTWYRHLNSTTTVKPVYNDHLYDKINPL